MDAELEKRITKLEKTIESGERIGRFERRAIRIGGVLIALLTILVILLNKVDDVVQAAMRIGSHFFGP